MARIIGTAGVRLVADGRGLGGDMRRELQLALKEASIGLGDGVTDGIRQDAERTSNRVRGILGTLGSFGQIAARGLTSAVTSGAKLSLIGAKAGVALAGVGSLVTTIGALGQAAVAAAGALLVLPAAFIALKAVTATVQLGLQGVGDAFSALASGDTEAFNESLKKLSPNARAFVNEVGKFKPAFDRLQQGLQQEIFAGLNQDVAQLGGRYLPIARDFFIKVGSAANSAAKDVIGFANDGEVAGQVSVIADNIAGAFRELVPALAPALSAITDIAFVGSDFLPGAADKVSGLAISFGEFVREAAGSGQLQAAIQGGLDTLKQLGQVLIQVGGIIGAVFSAAAQAGTGFGGSLVETLRSVNAFLSAGEGRTALVNLFTGLQTIMQALVPIVLTVAGAVGTTLIPILAQVAQAIIPAFAPIAGALSSAFAAAGPGIVSLAESFGQIIQAAAPLVPVIGQLVGLFGNTLGAVFRVLAPIIAQVATILQEQLAKALPILQPILVKVAEAVGQVLTALLPLIPVFFQLLQAVLPILPPLLELVASVLPAVVSIITSLVPIVVALAEVVLALIPPFQAVINILIGILVPVINLVVAIVTNMATFIATAITTMSQIVTGVLTVLGTIFTGIWGAIVNTVTGAVNAVLSFVRGGFNAVHDVIRTVINGIKSVVGDGIEGVVGFFRDLPGKVLGFLKGIASDAFNVGGDIIDGIVRGISSAGSAIKEKLVGLAKDAWGAVKNFFGISSPSRLAIETFEDVGRGAVIGLDKTAPDVADAALSMAQDAAAALAVTPAGVSPNLRAAVAANAAVGAGGGVVVNQTNVMQEGADVSQFSTEVSRNLAQRLTSGSSGFPVARGSVQRGMAPAGSVFGVAL